MNFVRSRFSQIKPALRGVVATAAAAAIVLSLNNSLPVASAAEVTGAPVSGIDVSDHQHPTLAGINWNDVKSDGQSFAYVKATEGETYINAHFVTDANAAALAGLQVGAYHYARPSSDPVKQAAAFAAQLALVPGQKLPPVLDLEVSEGKTPEELIAWTRAFVSELQHLTGRTPMIYTYRYFWTDEMADTKEFSELPLWLAAYQDKAPEPMGGWNKIAFWQRSDAGRVGGIAGPVDMNIFNGTQAQLDSFSAGNYIDFGGILETLVVPGVDLSGDAGKLIAAILAVGAGAAVAPTAAPVIEKAIKDANLGDSGAQIANQAVQLLNSGAVRPEQLQEMLKGNASLGDLEIMLDNAQHLKEFQNNVPAAVANPALASLADAAAQPEAQGILDQLRKLF